MNRKLMLGIMFLSIVAATCEAGDRHGGHHHHHRWWWRPTPYYVAPYYTAPYYVAPYYTAPYYVAQPRPPIGGTPTVVLEQPQWTPNYMGDPRYAPQPVPQAQPQVAQQGTGGGSVQVVPQPQPIQPTPAQAPVRRVRVDIKNLWEHRIIRHITGDPLTPEDLPEDGAIMICNAKSGSYRLGNGTDKYQHQQRCWIYEHPTGSEILRWEYIGKGQ